MLRLTRISYIENESSPRSWELRSFEPIEVNLLVGKNATGKTRILNVINGLANMVAGARKLQFTTGDYSLEFEDETSVVNYRLQFRDQQVITEVFKVNGETRLERSVGGSGRIFAAKLNDSLEFQTPPDELAVVARRDTIQHGFFEPLHDWANAVRHYPFGTPLGRETFVILKRGEQQDEFNPKEHDKTIIAFLDGKRRWADPFVEQIKGDLHRLGYSISSIDTKVPSSIRLAPGFPSEPLGLSLQEDGLACTTDQTDISQGMFRALALLTHLAYARFSDDRPSAILIDDIGEGLDFDRSCHLIDLVVAHCTELGIQLIMTSNDRNIMNRVPLKYWSVVVRTASTCEIFTERNAREVFDDFRMTGLNNVDFLTTDFISNRVR